MSEPKRERMRLHIATCPLCFNTQRVPGWNVRRCECGHFVGDATGNPTVRCSRCGREVKESEAERVSGTIGYGWNMNEPPRICLDRVACDKARKEEAK